MSRILSLDGGGIRGLITALILDEISNQIGDEWLDKVDLFAGTSTGGILALGLAFGKTPAEMANLYLKSGKEIFDNKILDFYGFFGANYSNKNLKAELDNMFGGATLDDLDRKVVIPAFDLDNNHTDPLKRTWKPKIFHNYSEEYSDGNTRISNVALYTSAAPTYFPSADGYIDGGVFANNPSVIAIAQAISDRNLDEEQVKIENILMLSIGTGANLRHMKDNNIKSGKLGWAKSFVDISVDGVSGIADFQAKQLLKKRYKRLQIPFAAGEKIKLDDVNKIGRMQTIAGCADISETITWLEGDWLKK